jgi:hypothetical protein
MSGEQLDECVADAQLEEDQCAVFMLALQVYI